VETRLLIGGEQVAGDGGTLDVENPATEETVAGVGLPSAEQLDAAVVAAAEAFPAWAGMPAVERADLLHDVAARLRARTDDLARVMTLEGGKPLVENSDEVGWTAAAFDYYAEMGRNFAGRVIPPIESTQLALVVKEPIGPWACIVPWNYPLLLFAWKVAPAIAAGNTVVGKPSELTPLSTLMLADCFAELPPGVVNLVAGAGDVGAALVDDARIEGVAFTGSVETGKKVAAACASRIARMNLEMGGKDPFIVCADVAADVGVAARGGAWAAYLNAGQVCTSAERFYVAREVYDDFVSEFVDYTSSLRVGDPMDGSTDLGPMVSAPQRAKVEAQLEAAVGAGAEVLVGGDRAGFELDCAAARGDLRPGGADRARGLARRGDPAGERHALRPGRERLHARPRDGGAVHARDQGRNGLDQRPAHRQRRRPVRRDEAVRLRPRARAGGSRGLPGDQARPHGDEDRAEGLVVPVRRMTSLRTGHRPVLAQG
jgi:betaine-aldehyde dehydrogenase